MKPKDRIILSIIVGILSGLGTYYFPVSTIFDGAHLGDLAPPLFSMKNFICGYPVYGGQFMLNSPVTAYPFTTILALYPFSLMPLSLAGPVFFSLSSSLFAYALFHDGKFWRILVLLSPPYIFSLINIQFAPLIASAYVLPWLLPTVCLKPQLGVALCASGKWNFKIVLATTVFIAVSLLVYPKWPTDWLRNGNITGFAGKIPVLTGVGFVLLLSVIKWRDRRNRLLAAMSVIPQRLWYDQLILFFIPETLVQLCILLACSWISLLLSMMGGWFLQSGMQHPMSWLMVVHFFYIPSLIMVYSKEIRQIAMRLKNHISFKADT